MNIHKTDTLIFDLGGVIINLDFSKTISKLAQMARMDPDEMVKLCWHNEAFHQHEKGEIEDHQFRTFLRDSLNIKASEEQLDEAWNAMILDIPADRLRLLRSLKEDYQLFLLSNTNNIHLQRVNEVFEPINGEVLDHYFIQSYYSHQVGMRKPDKDIFEKVIDDHGLNPAQTIFFDDNEQNIKGAESVGLQTFRVEHPDQIKVLFNAEKI